MFRLSSVSDLRDWRYKFATGEATLSKDRAVFLCDRLIEARRLQDQVIDQEKRIAALEALIALMSDDGSDWWKLPPHS